MNNRVESHINKIKKSNTYVDKKTEIAAEFNNFFSTIGKNIDEKTPQSNKNFNDYLTEEHGNIFVLREVDYNEILFFLSQMKSSKSCGPTSIPNNLLKKHKCIFSTILVTLINKSLREGTFPALFKLANVIPIYKKRTNPFALTIGPYPFCQI